MLFKGYYWDKMLLGFSALVVEKNKEKKKDVSGPQNSSAWFEYKWLTVISMLGSLLLITVSQTRLIWQPRAHIVLNTSSSITLRRSLLPPLCEYFLIGHYNFRSSAPQADNI